MILELNKQRVSSDYIELFKLQTPGGWLYFTTYESSVYFRDKESPYTNRLYIPLPIQFSGFEQKSEGAYARPKVSFANVLTTFSDALDGITNDDLVGMQLVRRKTLATHLDNAGGTAHGAPAAPVEYPTQSFILDRVEGTNNLEVSFELASPFDLAGVLIPARTISPNTCPWAYQGAAADSPFTTKVGGCTWQQNGSNNGFIAYFDSRNSLFADKGVHSIAAITSSAVAANDFFRVSKSLSRVNVDTSTTAVSSYDYYQAAAAGTTAYRRVRFYATYNGSTTYYTYINGEIYNDVVYYGSTLWLCIKSHAGSQTPSNSSKYWKRAELCGKKLSSCAIRFRSQQVTNATGLTVAVTENTDGILKYGGYPASRRYNYTN